MFAFQYALQSGMVPVGILLGGLLADLALEPWGCRADFPAVFLVGSGPGAGMALLFLFTGVLGVGISLYGLCGKRLGAAVSQGEAGLPDRTKEGASQPEARAQSK